MNFTTDLPKGRPLVSYIVASAIKCAKYFPKEANEGPCFRMHAVVLKDTRIPDMIPLLGEQRKLNGGKGLVLCHLRKASKSTNEPGAETGKRRASEESQSEEEKHPRGLGPEILSPRAVQPFAAPVNVPQRKRKAEAPAGEAVAAAAGIKGCCEMVERIRRVVAARSGQGKHVDYVQLYKFFPQSSVRSVVNPIFLPHM